MAWSIRRRVRLRGEAVASTWRAAAVATSAAVRRTSSTAAFSAAAMRSSAICSRRRAAASASAAAAAATRAASAWAPSSSASASSSGARRRFGVAQHRLGLLAQPRRFLQLVADRRGARVQHPGKRLPQLAAEDHEEQDEGDDHPAAWDRAKKLSSCMAVRSLLSGRGRRAPLPTAPSSRCACPGAAPVSR